MLDSRLSPHLLDGVPVMVRETADWFCLPQYRTQMLGLRLLRKMQACGDPMLVIGGSVTNRDLLAKLHWRKLSPARNYILPATMRGLLANLLRVAWPPHEALARLVPHTLPYRPHRRRPSPGVDGVRCVYLGPDRWFDLASQRVSGLAAELGQQHWAWLNAMPRGFAQPLGLLFLVRNDVLGVSLSQIEPAAAGLDARILHVQVAHRDDRLLARIFAETAAELIAQGADFIRCRVSAPAKIAAAEVSGFRFVQEVPCFWWSTPGMPVPAAADLGYLRGDDALPLPALRGRRLSRRHRGREEPFGRRTDELARPAT